MPPKGVKGRGKVVDIESSSVDSQKLDPLEKAGNTVLATEVSGNIPTFKRGRQKIETKEKLSEKDNKTDNDVKSKTKRAGVEIKTKETGAKKIESENLSDKIVETKNLIVNCGPKICGRNDILNEVGEKVINSKEVNPVKQRRKKKETESSKIQIDDQEYSNNNNVDNFHSKVEDNKNFEEEIDVPKKRGRKKVEKCLEIDVNSEQKLNKNTIGEMHKHPKSQNSSDFNTNENKIFKEDDPIKNAKKENLKIVSKSKQKAVEKQSDEIKSEFIEKKAPAKRGRKKKENILPEKMEIAEINLKDSTTDVSEVAKNSKSDSECKETSTVPLVDVPSRQGRAKRKDVENLDGEKSNLKHVAKKGKNTESSSHVHSSVKECCVVLQRNEDLAGGFQSHANKIEVESIQEPEDGGTSKGKKGKRNKQDLNEGDNEEIKSQPSKVPKRGAKGQEFSNIAKTPNMKSLNFSNDSTNSKGTPWNLKISSWNVNGIRAWLEKDGLAYLHHEKPDIMSLQETKCSSDKLPNQLEKIEGYHSYWLSGDKDGYSGIGLISKQKPIEVKYGIDIEEHDNEGRVITSEYETFFCVAAYVPNSGRGLVRLDYRTKWDKDFHSYLKVLDQKKPVVLCGDLNVAHEEIDLANPKTNKKNAGFTKEEREGFSALLEEGFIDTFRHLYPDEKGAYTFWTYMMNARAKNVGWRLDYFVISKRFLDNVCDCVIRKEVYGSDHCPIVLFLAVQ